MKKLIVVLFATIIIANIAFGQADSKADSKPKTKSGDKAWLFTLNGLSDLGAGNFNGGVGAKYYISDGNAIRLGLGFATASTTTKYTGPPSATAADIKQSGTGFSISPAFLHGISISGPVCAYIGAELMYTTTSTTTENPGFVANNKVHDADNTFTIAGLAGVEWFAWDVISIAAEYHLGYSSTSGTHEQTTAGATTTTDHPSSTAFAMGSVSGANFTVAIFW